MIYIFGIPEWEHFDFFSLQHAKSFRYSFETSKCALNAFACRDQTSIFLHLFSVEIILPCRNTKTSITMEKKCVSIACSPSQSNTSFHLLLLQWSCNSFFQNETTSVAENETDIAGRAVQVLRYLSGRKDFRAGGPAPNTYWGQHVYTNTLTK